MKYLFWDFNGTVLDDAKLCYDILNEMLIEEKRPTVTFDEYLMIFDFPVESYYAKVYDLEKTSFKELAHTFIERYMPRSLELNLHEGVLNAIHQAKHKGYQNILLSASEESNLQKQLVHFGIDQYFDAILGTSNVYAKSKVDVALQFIKKHHINPQECYMVGDTLHDAEVAEALGIQIIIYTKGHQHPSRLGHYTNINHFNELLDKI
ncbi:MAG: HAD-IA family hydrolase [Acholeplasmataceae bacterium]